MVLWGIFYLFFFPESKRRPQLLKCPRSQRSSLHQPDVRALKQPLALTGKSGQTERVALPSNHTFPWRLSGRFTLVEWFASEQKPTWINSRSVEKEVIESRDDSHSEFSFLTVFPKQNCINEIESIISMKLQLIGIVGIGIAGLTVRKFQNVPFFFFFLPSMKACIRLLLKFDMAVC